MKIGKAIRMGHLNKRGQKILRENFPCNHCEYIDDEDKDNCECNDVYRYVQYLSTYQSCDYDDFIPPFE